MPRISRLFLFATSFIAPAVLLASDPGDRAFTPLAGGSFGESASVGSQGNLIASLPLLLPTPRGGLPMPFTVAWTGSNSTGAAGLGWDIPIAAVTRQHNLSRRKPVHQFDSPVKPFIADRLFLNTGSGPSLMVPTENPGVFQPFGNGYFELTAVRGGFVGRDAQGRTWTFHYLPALLDFDFFPLISITDAGGANSVFFRYEVFDKFSPDPLAPPFDPNQVSMRELVLAEITHSFDSSGTCPKYRIQLDYTPWTGLDFPVTYPNLVALDFAAGRPRARTRLLHDVRVQSNANTSCASGARTERTYRITYAADPLTGQPRLSKVDWFGSGDTATNPQTALPMIAYQYGNPLNAGELRYTQAENLALPSGPQNAIAGFSTSLTSQGIYGRVRDFQDMNGDGRADFFSLSEDRSHPILSINRPSSLGNDFSTLTPPVNLPNTPAAPYNLGAPDLSFNLPVVADIENLYQQVIDFNGDGRPDILIATEGRNPSGHRDPNYWKLLVNTPGPSGNPWEIVWLDRQIDVTALRAEIQRFHQLSPVSSDDQASKPLPVMRTHQTGAFDNNNTVVESAVLTQWKLIDVNGDGFPDFVFDRLPVQAWNDSSCDSTGHCQQVLRQDHPPTNRLMVIYHTGPMMAGSGADTQNVWNGPPVELKTDGACGIDRLKWLGGGQRRLECGFMDVNGDGLVDYIRPDGNGFRALRFSGLAEVDDHSLPDNPVNPDYDDKRTILLPGPVDRINDPRGTACSSNGAGSYAIEQRTALRDITGDGIADYIYFGMRGALEDGTPLFHPDLTSADRRTALGWWFMAGTGVGFAAPRAIRVPEGMAFALHSSRERCDGSFSGTTAGLVDIDGDGRPELVQFTPPAGLLIAKLDDGSGALGAHSAGQLTAIDNRYGGILKITYGSAKSAPNARENVPFPQIVVTAKEQTATRGLGNSLAPVRYAYGSPKMAYHSPLGRWVFTGYDTRIELIGEPGPLSGTLKGTANVYGAVLASDVAGDAAKLMLAGRPNNMSVLAGILPEDPRRLLADSLGLRPVANRHTEWRTQPLPGDVPLLVPLQEECYATPPPESPGMFGDLVLCRRASSAYIREQTTWEGDEAFPSPNSIATRVAINTVDDYARPTLIQVDGDRTRTDDDHCIEIAWASSVDGGPLVLDSPHTVRAFTCGNTSRILSGVRYLYDGLPEGSAGAGLPSGRVLERHDLSNGTLLEEIQSGEIQRDIFGNIVRIIRTRPDGAVATTSIDYDPFGLMPVRSENTATGLAQPLVSKATRDANSLLPLTIVDQNGTAMYNKFDRFGRLQRQSVSLPGDSMRKVLMDVDYVGFAGNSGPRTIKYRVFHAWTNEQEIGNADPATVGTYTETLDELGRKTDGIVELGADYNRQSLVVDFTVYDLLGRPSFVADPFPETEFLHYGTTFTYRADGRPECWIQGLGIQTIPTTDEANNRFASCSTFVYGNNQLAIQTSGPNELAQGKPQSGAFDEMRLSGTGAVLETSRSRNNTKLELMQYIYDPLGNVASVTRFGDPQGQTGRAMWQFVSDSFGNLLTLQEPAGVSRNNTYDAWGNLTAVDWRDSTGIVSIMRGKKFRYDGLSRLTHSEEIQNGQTIDESVHDYFYDQSSGLPQQLDSNFLAGRLAYARTPQRSVFLGYDGLGRLSAVSRSEGGNAPYYAERQVLGPSGEIESLDLLLPDTNHVPERIAYAYDTARRPRSVRFMDQSGSLEVWRALETDVFGRVLQARLGNGAIETYSYRPDARRELLGKKIQTASGVRELLLAGYDAGLLLKGFSETGPLDGSPSTVTAYQYDARNALARATVQHDQSILADTGYNYDGLGNVHTILDYRAQKTTAIDTYKFDPDRICNITTIAGIVPDPPVSPAGICQYRYDALGNVAGIADRHALFVHDGSGRLTSGDQAGQTMSLSYDPLGALADLRLVQSGVDRRDHLFGGTSARVEYFDAAGHPLTVGDSGARFQSYIERSITSPMGRVAAVRRSNSGQRVVLYPVDDYQATRAVLGADNKPKQTIAYSAFGEVVADSLHSTSLFWWPRQWNGGHTLTGFSLTLLGERVLDPATGRFLERDPEGAGAGSSVANPYAFAWDNPVKFADETGAQPDPNGDQGGAVAGTVSFVGAAANTIGLAGILNRPPAQPGEKVDPYIEMGWACNLDHDCMSAVESTYGLTDFEKGLRKHYHTGTSVKHVDQWNNVYRDDDYHVILDRISGAVIGYAVFDNNITIYNRNGDARVVGSNEPPVESSFFQPADLIAGPIVGFGRRLLGREAAAAIETAIADEATEGMYAVGRPIQWGQGSNFKPGVLGNTSFDGQITLNPGLKAGTQAFKEALRHELCHRCLTPLGDSAFTVFRQNARRFFYRHSTLLRYAEEAVAETYSKGSLRVGLVYPFANGNTYLINPWRLAAEAGIYGGTLYGSYRLGAWLGGDQGDAP